MLHNDTVVTKTKISQGIRNETNRVTAGVEPLKNALQASLNAYGSCYVVRRTAHTPQKNRMKKGI